jgi:hypothetical protein
MSYILSLLPLPWLMCPIQFFFVYGVIFDRSGYDFLGYVATDIFTFLSDIYAKQTVAK